jgi:hypothetical protein
MAMRHGPNSVDLVFVAQGPSTMVVLARESVWLAAMTLAAAAVLALTGGFVVGLVAFVIYILGGDVSPKPVLVITLIIFLAALAYLAWSELTGTRRIELRPPEAPTELHLISRLGATIVPMTELYRVELTHKVVQSEVYPFTPHRTGLVEVRLHLFDRVVKAGSLDVDVQALADELVALLRPAEVTVDIEAIYPPFYERDVVDDWLPPDGIVLEIMKRRRPTDGHDPFKPRVGYLSGREAQAAWPMVWWVQKAAEANHVRAKPSSYTVSHGSFGWMDFRAVDVQRVADEIAAGTAVLDPTWRNDTEDGRAAHAQFRAAHPNNRT